MILTLWLRSDPVLRRPSRAYCRMRTACTFCSLYQTRKRDAPVFIMSGMENRNELRNGTSRTSVEKTVYNWIAKATDHLLVRGTERYRSTAHHFDL